MYTVDAGATAAVVVDRNDWLWDILRYAQYTLNESYGSISVATFWSFVEFTLSLEDAKMYDGVIVTTVQIGAIRGGTTSTFWYVPKPTLVNRHHPADGCHAPLCSKIFLHGMVEDDYGSVPSVVSVEVPWVICYAVGMRFNLPLKGGGHHGVVRG